MNQRHSSSAVSGTTYHSFNDVELFEPASPPRKQTNRPNSSEDERPPTATAMKRQDSGYESRNTTPRNSISHSHTRPSPPPRRRTSTSASTASAAPRSRAPTRPSTRRSAKSYHHPNSSSVHVVKPPVSAPVVVQSSYFQFPSPDPEEDIAKQREELNVTPAPVPPQPTHYWTSDRTRRLEYAAIDAAQRGVKGWIRRNLLPDCISARDERHIPFDDDTGSVRRYRLELEDDDEKSVAVQKRKTWHFWS